MSATFTIDIPELAILQKHWGVLPATMKAQVQATLTRSAISVQTLVKAQAPVKTNRLRGSVDFAIVGNTAIIGGKMVKYAPWVHGGTGLYGPHRTPIVPKNKTIMATTVNPGFGIRNAAGYFILGKSVKGQKANPFMKRAYIESKPLVKAEFRAMMQAIVDGLKK